MAQSPTTILDGLGRRSPDALAAFYDDCGGILYGLILRIVGNGGAAEIIFERTFRQIWNYLYNQVRSDSELRAVALLLGRREAIQYRRGLPDRPAHNGTRVSIEIERNRSKVALKIVDNMNAAVNRFSVEDRELFDAVYFEGRSLSEIAAQTGADREEVGDRVAAIFKVLRRATENNNEEEANESERSDRVPPPEPFVHETSSRVSQIPSRSAVVKAPVVSRNGPNRMPNGTC